MTLLKDSGGTAGETYGTISSRVAVLREAPLNVKEERFGAQCDGVTDDWAALSAARTLALTAAKAEIFIPPGVLLINSSHTFNPASNLKLFGAGRNLTTIKAGTGTSSNLIGAGGTTSAGASIEGLTVDCNSRGLVGIQIDAKGSTDFSITDVKVTNAAIAGVNLNGVTRPRVKGLYIDGVVVSGSGGVGLWIFNGTSDGEFEDVYIVNTELHGVALDAGTTGGVVGTTADLIRANKFTNVHVEDAAGVGFLHEGAANNTVNGLVLERCGSAGLPGAGQPALYFNLDQSALTSDDNVVTGAVILDSESSPVAVRSGSRNRVQGTARGIGMGGSNSPAAFLYAFTSGVCNDNVIDLNASDNAGAGTYLNYALLRGEAATTVNGNRVRGNPGRGADGPTSTVSSSSGSVVTVPFSGANANLVDAVVSVAASNEGQVGVMAPSRGGYGALSVTVTANRAYFARFVPTRDMTVTKIAFSVATIAGSNDNVDVGIYDAAYGKIVSSGATAGKLNGSTGTQTVTITSTPLTAGTVYYAALSTGAIGTTGVALSMTSIVGALGDTFGSTAGLREVSFEAAAHPLPTTHTSGGAIASVPYLGIRES